MFHRIAAVVLAFALLVGGGGAGAQPSSRVPRLGWLSAATSPSEFPEKQTLEGLRALGWIDGKNVVIEFRHAAGDVARLKELAGELVRLKVDVIVTWGVGVGVAKAATTTMPVVFGTSQDPVRAGFVARRARPGGNLTGVTYLTDELSAKRLELLKEALPALSRAAILWEPAHVDNEYRGMQAATAGLGIRLQSLEVPRPPRPTPPSRWDGRS